MAINIEPMGQVPIGNVVWPEFEQHKQKIIDLCLHQERPNTIESGIGTPIKSNIWESTFDFLTANPEVKELYQWCGKSVADFSSIVNKKNQEAMITSSWAHVTRPNGYHGPHRHPWSAWSGIFYVCADDESSGYNQFHKYFDMPRIPGYEFWEETFIIPFKPGSLVIFPSTMLHYAPPYLGKDYRIVIAFNSVIKP